VLGALCESEGRTGRPLVGVNRIYWHQWATIGEQELRALEQGILSNWTLPTTSSEEEFFRQQTAGGGES